MLCWTKKETLVRLSPLGLWLFASHAAKESGRATDLINANQKLDATFVEGRRGSWTWDALMSTTLPRQPCIFLLTLSNQRHQKSLKPPQDHSQCGWWDLSLPLCPEAPASASLNPKVKAQTEPARPSQSSTFLVVSHFFPPPATNSPRLAPRLGHCYRPSQSISLRASLPLLDKAPVPLALATFFSLPPQDLVCCAVLRWWMTPLRRPLPHFHLQRRSVA